MAVETDDRRAALEAAFTQAEVPAETPETPAEPAAEAAPVEPAEAAQVEPVPEAQEEAESSASGERDAKGRFLAKVKGEKPAPVVEKAALKPTGAAAVVEPPAAKPEEPVKPALKAPGGWKPGAREHWAKLPSEVQEEVHRREKETAVSLQRAAEKAKEAERAQAEAAEFQKVVAPYEGLIRAAGGTPLTAIGNLLQTAAALQTGTVGHKAQLIANLVRTYGVPEEALAAAIDGQPVPQGQAQSPGAVHPVVAQLQAELQEMKLGFTTAQKQTVERQYQRVQSELEDFAASHEFFDDVRETMADLVDIDDKAVKAGKRASVRSNEELYDLACRLTPEIDKVRQQREAAETAAKVNASTQRSKLAASSVKTQPSGAGGGGPDRNTRLGALEAAYDAHAGR